MSPARKTPAGWKPGTLQDLVFFQRGYDITKAQQSPGDVPVVSSSGVNSYHSEAKVDGPGVVIGRKGSLGTVHYVDGAYWPHDTTLWSKDLRGNHPRFVYYFLHMLGLERYDVGSSNPTLNRNHIHGLNIAIPTPVIQEKIADVLSIYDDLIENNRRRIQLLELAARMLYEEWFVHLRFPGHEHVKLTDGVPEGWEKKPLEDCVSVIETGSRPKGGVGNYTEGIPSIGAESIESVGVFDFSKVKYVPESYFARLRTGVVQDRDVLVYKDGGRPGHFIPHVSMFGNVFPFETMALNSHVYRVRGIPTTSQEFLYFHLSSDGMLSWMNNAGSGAAIPGIARKNLLRLPVLMPTHSLMTNFTEVACNCVSQILGVAQSSKKLADARDLLLPRLMTGEILV